MASKTRRVHSEFQFPVRNSGCSDLSMIVSACVIVVFQFPVRNSGCSDRLSWAKRDRCRVRVFQFPVRNSGCSDIRLFLSLIQLRLCFNSLFGILAVQTSFLPVIPALNFRFQFPVRNSGCSDAFGPFYGLAVCLSFQFPVRNSGCSDAKSKAPPRRWILCSFNSLFGILAVQTAPPSPYEPYSPEFQFPVRNSGCSDLTTPAQSIR